MKALGRIGTYFANGFWQGCGLGAALWCLHRLLDLGVAVWFIQ